MRDGGHVVFSGITAMFSGDGYYLACLSEQNSLILSVADVFPRCAQLLSTVWLSLGKCEIILFQSLQEGMPLALPSGEFLNYPIFLSVACLSDSSSLCRQSGMQRCSPTSFVCAGPPGTSSAIIQQACGSCHRSTIHIDVRAAFIEATG